MYSRLSFEVHRREPFPEPCLIWTLMATAQQKDGLRGEINCVTQTRYTVKLEGPRDSTDRYKKFVEYLECAIGEISAVEETHHHWSNAFRVNSVRVLFPL